MAKFGHAGKLIIRADQNEVKLSEGEYLHYRLLVQGARPRFALSNAYRMLWSDDDSVPGSYGSYEKSWPRREEEVDTDEDTHTFEIHFPASNKYRLVIEHRDASDQVLSVVKDLDLSSDDPRDRYSVNLNIFGDPTKRP